MTVEYSHDVQTSGALGNFAKLLTRWKGSIYKLVYPDIIIYVILYMMLFCLYRFYFANLKDQTHRVVFESVIKYCKDYGQMIPISFILGFYISQIISRWWSQFMTIPWPDTLAVLIATHLQGSGERSRLMRRTIIRYINLSFTMTMVMMSPQAKARFPTLEHLVDAGFLMSHEKLIIEHLNQKSKSYTKYWMPLIWAGSVVVRARREGRIADDIALNYIVRSILKFRTGLGDLLGYDWINIPLVYTQVVTLAVYLYFTAGLMGKQIQLPAGTPGDNSDVYIPVFLFAEFFFYMGWLKVAETMVNPWGEDEDDFEVNWLIDRHFMVAYLIVDEMHTEHPEMLKDSYWDDVVPEDLPYTAATFKYKKATTHLGSAVTHERGDYEKSQYGGEQHTLRQRMNSVFSPTKYGKKGDGTVEYGQPNTGVLNSRRASSASSGITPSPSEKYKKFMETTFVPMNDKNA